MSDIIILTTLEIIIIFLVIISINPIIRKLKQTKNKIYLGVILFQIAILTYSITQLYIYYYGTIQTFGAALDLTSILWLLIITLEIQFFLYLKNLKKLYTLPFIISFFIAAGLVLIADMNPLIYYSILSVFFIGFLLIREGYKNRNGIPFSLGLLIILMGMGFLLNQFLINELIRSIFWIIGMSFFFLGSWGFFDKYILIDKLEEQKIKNTWIARLVIEKRFDY